jgi:hypothetical protein
MLEFGETEQGALQNNVQELIGLRASPDKEAAERALQLSADCMRMLFRDSPEPQGEADELARAAAEARYLAGPQIHIWGREGDWEVWIDESEVGEDPAEELEERRQLIQRACDAGLREKTGEVAGQMAVTDANKAGVEARLLRLAGANDLSQSAEKAEVFRTRLCELQEVEKRAGYWTITKRTDFGETPEMKVVEEAVRKARP